MQFVNNTNKPNAEYNEFRSKPVTTTDKLMLKTVKKCWKPNTAILATPIFS